MKILVVGGGGREHALVWKIAQSPLVEKIYCAPGNGGIASLAECINIASDDVNNLLHFAFDNKIDLTVVGPEVPLVNGIVDAFNDRELAIVGPSMGAAELEGSKVYSKQFMRKYSIPTPASRTFTDSKAAVSFVKEASYPLVVKASGLAAGKGTIICNRSSEAIVALEGIMEKRIFGTAGDQVLIEEYITGHEASVIALTDSKSILVLETSKDHKRIHDGDKGANTGGMGAYSPVPSVSEAETNMVIHEVLVPTVHGMKREGHPFKGVIYAGIMFTENGIKVLEYNVRFGDPETQPLMKRLKSDIVPIFQAICNETLDQCDIEWHQNAAVCIVMASGGYPNTFQKGYEITGIQDAEANEHVKVFHAGTTNQDDQLVTSGGRVLGVTGTGSDIEEARTVAYDAVSKISFTDAHYRTDIAASLRLQNQTQ